MGCGIWGGNITNENISLKHYMNVTWVSRPIPEDRPSEAGTVRRVLQHRTRSDGGPDIMSTATTPAINRTSPATGTRIASYLLAEYLERLGVEVIFGLCGHTVIALLDALGKSRIRFVTHAPRAGGRARRRRVRARVRQGRACC